MVFFVYTRWKSKHWDRACLKTSGLCSFHPVAAMGAIVHGLSDPHVIANLLKLYAGILYHELACNDVFGAELFSVTERRFYTFFPLN